MGELWDIVSRLGCAGDEAASVGTTNMVSAVAFERQERDGDMVKNIIDTLCDAGVYLSCGRGPECGNIGESVSLPLPPEFGVARHS